MVTGSGGRADQETTVKQQEKVDCQCRVGRVTPAVLSEMIIAPENSLGMCVVCVCVCVCVLEMRAETSLPPLNAPESVSMVMNKHN